MRAIASIIGFVMVVLLWSLRAGRRSDKGFEFVYVNQDGSARELSPGEQAYLSEEWSGGDGPYIKSRYKSRDGWGSLAGFIERRKVPAQCRILPVHPDFDARTKALGFDILDLHRAAGDTIETRADGSTVCLPNPEISKEKRFELMRSSHLAHAREREKLAVADDSNDEANS